MSYSLKVGARGSPLSRVQVDEVLAQLRQFHPAVQFEPIFVETTGDKDQQTPLSLLDKSDFFTREIDELQLSGGCRISIHSAKDLPDPLPAGLILAALTAGVSSADVLVLRSGEALATLPQGARIGTSSLRREESLRALRSDLQPVQIRGTILTRLGLLYERHVDGVVMAEAALIRLQLTHLNQILLAGQSAPLQGQLAVVACRDDLEMVQLFQAIDSRNR